MTSADGSGSGDRSHPRTHDAPGASAAAVDELASMWEREDVVVDTTAIDYYEDFDGEWDADETALFVGAAVRDAGRVLCIRNHWSDGWTVPGGRVEPGERLAPAAVREVREETGVEARIERPVFVQRQVFRNPSDPSLAATGYYVEFEGVATELTLAADPGVEGEEILAVEWFERTDVPETLSRRERIVEDLYGD